MEWNQEYEATAHFAGAFCGMRAAAQAEEDASAGWFSEAKVYLKEGSDRVIYLFVDSPAHMVGFYRARKKWF